MTRLLRCPWCPRHVIAEGDEIDDVRDAFRRLAEHALQLHRRGANELLEVMHAKGFLDG